MILDYKNGIKGGITIAVSHYLEVNNKSMFNYDDKKNIQTFSILILTINADGLYYNHFHMTDLHILNIYQCLNLTLL